MPEIQVTPWALRLQWRSGMRTLVLTLAITLAAGCFEDVTPKGGGKLPDECGGLVCSDADLACPTYPYEQLPPGCDEVCYTGRCCSLDEHGNYQVVIVDCTPPHPDAGTAAP